MGALGVKDGARGIAWAVWCIIFPRGSANAKVVARAGVANTNSTSNVVAVEALPNRCSRICIFNESGRRFSSPFRVCG